MWGAQARNLARDAGFFVVRIEEYGAVRVRAGVLEIGPDASEDAIVTLACRRQLHDIEIFDEACTCALVESLGYAYVPERALRSRSGVAYRAVS